MTEFVPITRYSRCKRYSGAVIKCPECHSLGQVYHLSWSALQCQNCEKMIDKFDWLKKVKLIELDEIDTSEDPVRPELDNWFRQQYGRKIYGLKDGCLLYTSPSPRD